jgi:hypothetical protein
MLKHSQTLGIHPAMLSAIPGLEKAAFDVWLSDAA